MNEETTHTVLVTRRHTMFGRVRCRLHAAETAHVAVDRRATPVLPPARVAGRTGSDVGSVDARPPAGRLARVAVAVPRPAYTKRSERIRGAAHRADVGRRGSDVTDPPHDDDTSNRAQSRRTVHGRRAGPRARENRRHGRRRASGVREEPSGRVPDVRVRADVHRRDARPLAAVAARPARAARAPAATHRRRRQAQAARDSRQDLAARDAARVQAAAVGTAAVRGGRRRRDRRAVDLARRDRRGRAARDAASPRVAETRRRERGRSRGSSNLSRCEETQHCRAVDGDRVPGSGGRLL